MFNPFRHLSGDKKKTKKQTEQEETGAKRIYVPRGKAPQKEPGKPYYEVVCPYCLNRYHIWEQVFRSKSVSSGDGANAQKGYPRERDELYVKFWHDMNQDTRNPVQNHVLHVNNPDDVVAVKLAGSDDWIQLNTDADRQKIKEKAVVAVKDKFGQESNRKLCPHCHNEVPGAIGLYPNYIFSLMGNTSSGKTVYADRLLLSLLNNELLPERQLVVSVLGEERAVVRRRLMDEFTARLSRKRSDSGDDTGEDDVPTTLSESTPIRYTPPTVLDVQCGEDHVLITLYDFPGEAIWRNDIRQSETVDLDFFSRLMNRMNENTNGWLFMLDSTTLPDLRNLILRKGGRDYLSQENLEDAKLNAEPVDVLDPFSHWFGDNNRIKPPVALVFSKADMISHYAEELSEMNYKVSPTSLFLQENQSPARRHVDVDQLWQCSCEIEEFLNHDPVIRMANTVCPVHGWFAVSATGTPVKNGVLERNASGRRITDPLEWLLWIDGAYPGMLKQKDVPWLEDLGVKRYDGE